VRKKAIKIKTDSPAARFMKIFLFLLQGALLYLSTIDTIINNNGKDFFLLFASEWGGTTGQARSLGSKLPIRRPSRVPIDAGLKILLIFKYKSTRAVFGALQLLSPGSGFVQSPKQHKSSSSLEEISRAGVSLGQLFEFRPPSRREMCKDL
jgi:hypothetical protein